MVHEGTLYLYMVLDNPNGLDTQHQHNKIFLQMNRTIVRQNTTQI